MSAWKQIKEALAYAEYDDPGLVMDQAAAELYAHVVDVIRIEFTGHQDWTCCAQARQSEDRAIVQRITDMAEQTLKRGHIPLSIEPAKGDPS